MAKKKGVSPIERAVLNTMDPLMQMMVLGPERGMQFVMQRMKRSLRSKMQRQVGYRALMTMGIAQTANAKVKETESSVDALLQATGQTSVEEALQWIQNQRAAQGAG